MVAKKRNVWKEGLGTLTREPMRKPHIVVRKVCGGGWLANRSPGQGFGQGKGGDLSANCYIALRFEAQGLGGLPRALRCFNP